MLDPALLNTYKVDTVLKPAATAADDNNVSAVNRTLAYILTSRNISTSTDLFISSSELHDSDTSVSVRSSLNNQIISCRGPPTAFQQLSFPQGRKLVVNMRASP